MSDSRSKGQRWLAELEQTCRVGNISELPQWDRFTPDRVVSAVGELLIESSKAFTELEQGLKPSWQELMDPLERINMRLGRILGSVIHLISVKYSDEMQAAYDAVRPDYIALSNRMGQSRAVYEGLLALRNNVLPENQTPKEPNAEMLSAAQQRILSESIRDMERSGVHLEGAERERYQAIQTRLADLSNQFQTNLVKEEQASRIRVTDIAWVHGVPAAVLSLAANQALEDGIDAATGSDGPWHFVVNGVNYMAVIQFAQNRELREKFYRAFRTRGMNREFDNRPVLEEILALRQEFANLVGFQNYAELSLDEKMASSVTAVRELLDQLEVAARPAAIREKEDLIRFMQDQGAPEAKDLAPWDIAFWSERLSEFRYQYDAESLRNYFQMPRVLDGLFALIHRLYGVEILRCNNPGVPVWDPSVEFFEVRKQGDVIAGFFVDPYARPGEKRGGAWMGRVVNKTRLLALPGHSASLPVALFVLNSRPPGDGQPALMSLDEVRTLFHEFGHATQHMFTTIEEGGASGMNLVEWDAVELASQFNEYWMEHKPFLRELTAHVQTAEPLSEEVLDRVIASRHFMVGTATLRQLQFAKTDLALHEQYGIKGAPDDLSPYVIERAIAQQTLILPQLEDETHLPAFGHLFAGGYAAGYYSYKWAEVLAADAFAAFKEAGLDDDKAVSTVAERFRDTVLALGGSRPAEEIYRLFRGRMATVDALLKEQGLLSE